MNFIIILSFLFVIFSCDMANKTRTPYGGNSFNYQGNNSRSPSNYSSSSSSNSPGSADTGSGGSSSITIPNEAKSCNWYQKSGDSFDHNSNHLGRYNICKTKTGSNNFIFIQLETPITSPLKICFIPTSNVGSNSFYIGEPRCFDANKKNSIYKVDILVNRPYFTSYPLTGVMMMKDESNFYGDPYFQNSLTPDAYLFCSEVLYQQGNPRYCETFKNMGKYVYHQF